MLSSVIPPHLKCKAGDTVASGVGTWGLTELRKGHGTGKGLLGSLNVGPFHSQYQQRSRVLRAQFLSFFRYV